MVARISSPGEVGAPHYRANSESDGLPVVGLPCAADDDEKPESRDTMGTPVSSPEAGPTNAVPGGSSSEPTSPRKERASSAWTATRRAGMKVSRFNSKNPPNAVDGGTGITAVALFVRPADRL